ncbi:hypothetical protein BDP81DRAFT_82390 [Colletotrichum phormii]|uniref:Uncharacterized protein n=1 Tax=Colletotrichum phormii TaxID=359342 RepID=A0AAJ0A0V2_9PEZI|nr:uncharacterized protein BDP81DRAFT_82390 [Colletotrichum phormii]KAK1654384.1 hypothetical protein BDP81DRAFT_82390 [Colletotrichum phormii]
MMLARSTQMLGSSFDWLRVPGLCTPDGEPSDQAVLQEVAGFCLVYYPGALGEAIAVGRTVQVSVPRLLGPGTDGLDAVSKAGLSWSVVGIMMQTLNEISQNGFPRCTFCRAIGWVLKNKSVALTAPTWFRGEAAVALVRVESPRPMGWL